MPVNGSVQCGGRRVEAMPLKTPGILNLRIDHVDQIIENLTGYAYQSDRVFAEQVR